MQSVDIGEGERVPTLEEFLDAAGNTPLALEVKTHPKDEQTTREVVAAASAARRGPQDRRDVARPRAHGPGPALEPDLATADLVSVAAGEMYLLPSDVIAPSDSLLSANLVFLAHAGGKRVWVWAVEDEALLREAVVRGVDGVIVSDIPAARRVLESDAGGLPRRHRPRPRQRSDRRPGALGFYGSDLSASECGCLL